MFSRSRRSISVPRARRRADRRPQVEGLEGRPLLSLSAINFGATVTTRSAPAAIGSELYFTATESAHGNQVWATNGTASGTFQLSDGHDVNGVNGGIFPASLTAVDSKLFFSASDFVHGYQIWSSDGTPGGRRRSATSTPTAARSTRPA